MEIESLAAALEREHHEIDDGIAAFTASPGNPQSLTRAIRALRRHIYLEEQFLFPLLRQAEPGLAAPVSVMLREHAQMWATLDTLERELHDGTGLILCRQLTVRLLHHNLKEERILYPRADDVLRRLGAEIPRAAARRFNQVAWPAFAVLILTGVWNVIAVRSQISGSYETTLVVKLLVVAISGVTAALHARARSAAGLAVFGALTGLSALAALFLGILLAG